jgi:predicted DNA-binding transcriptional regulator YafY
MPLIDTIHRLERLDQLICFQKTGTPENLAKLMNISERTLYRYIDYLKELGCPIYYDEEKESDCHKSQGKLVMKYVENTFGNE